MKLYFSVCRCGGASSFRLAEQTQPTERPLLPWRTHPCLLEGGGPHFLALSPSCSIAADANALSDTNVGVHISSCRQVMVIFIVFGGVYVNAANVPAALKWLPNISMIKYCFEALCVNEFRGLDFESRGGPGEVATGEQVRPPDC